MKIKTCEHLKNLDLSELKKASSYECHDCVLIGGNWVHLRTCQICGTTLCCDSSPNKHANKHFIDHGHGIITSAEPNEYWAWCYEDKAYLKFKP